MFRRLTIIIPTIILLLLIFFFTRGLKQDPHLLPSTLIHQPAPAFQAQELLHPNQIYNQSLFQGHWSVFVVWASWCESCVNEVDSLMRLKKQYPYVQFVGLDEKDRRADALVWLKKNGNPFDLILQDSAASDIAINYGVYGTPETFLIAPNGKIVAKQVGVLTEKTFQTPLSRSAGEGGA